MWCLGSDETLNLWGCLFLARAHMDNVNMIKSMFHLLSIVSYRIGEKYTDVNTQDFRTGIWNYIHCIMGIRHDDYDYGRINSLLERGLKSFIKLMTCYPERVSKKDFDGVMKGFTYSEKVSLKSNSIKFKALRCNGILYSFYHIRKARHGPSVVRHCSQIKTIY